MVVNILAYLFRKKKHRKSEELKRLQAEEVVTAGDSVEQMNRRAASESSKKTKAEQAFQKAKEERVTNHETSLWTGSTVYVDTRHTQSFSVHGIY